MSEAHQGPQFDRAPLRTNTKIEFTPAMVAIVHLERAKAIPTPWPQMAEMLGISVGTMMRWAYESGIQTNPRKTVPSRAFADPAKRKRFAPLWLDPTVSKAAMAKSLGVNRKTLDREASRQGLGEKPAYVAAPRPKGPSQPRKLRDIDWPESRIVRLRALLAEGHSPAEIGRRLGVTRNAVIGKAHRLNLPSRPSPIRGPRVAREKVAVKPKAPSATSTQRREPGNSASIERNARPDIHRLFDNPEQGERHAAVSRAAAKSPLPVPGARLKHPRGCQWHMGRDGLTHLFCGEPIDEQNGGSWCATHRALCFVPGSRLRRSADAA